MTIEQAIFYAGAVLTIIVAVIGLMRNPKSERIRAIWENNCSSFLYRHYDIRYAHCSVMRGPAFDGMKGYVTCMVTIDGISNIVTFDLAMSTEKQNDWYIIDTDGMDKFTIVNKRSNIEP